MPFPDSSTIAARKRAAYAEAELANLWEFLISEDLVEEAQNFIAKQEGFDSYEEMIKEH